MRMPRVSAVLLTGITFFGLIAWIALASAAGQTLATPAFDPLSGYVGTWIATNPGETLPFLVLKLTETSGALTGTMSRFTVGGQLEGHILFRPLPQPADQISDLKISDSDLSFHWVGDTPFHGGDVVFVAEGTDAAYIMLPISQDEWERIYAENWGLGEASPMIALYREGTPSVKRQETGLSDGGASLINQAEFLYKSHYGMYADYPSLVRSGELEKSGGHFKLAATMRLQLRSDADPFPGRTIRLVVSQDGATYRLSIEWKPSASCSVSVASDQTGVAAERQTGDCTNAAERPR
jgi:hypothetical protein